jgi:hypothetical protein
VNAEQQLEAIKSKLVTLRARYNTYHNSARYEQSGEIAIAMGQTLDAIEQLIWAWEERQR